MEWSLTLSEAFLWFREDIQYSSRRGKRVKFLISVVRRIIENGRWMGAPENRSMKFSLKFHILLFIVFHAFVPFQTNRILFDHNLVYHLIYGGCWVVILARYSWITTGLDWRCKLVKSIEIAIWEGLLDYNFQTGKMEQMKRHSRHFMRWNIFRFSIYTSKNSSNRSSLVLHLPYHGQFS